MMLIKPINKSVVKGYFDNNDWLYLDSFILLFALVHPGSRRLCSDRYERCGDHPIGQPATDPGTEPVRRPVRSAGDV